MSAHRPTPRPGRLLVAALALALVASPAVRAETQAAREQAKAKAAASAKKAAKKKAASPRQSAQAGKTAKAKAAPGSSGAGSDKLRQQASATRASLQDVQQQLKEVRAAVKLTAAERAKKEQELLEAERKIGVIRRDLRDVGGEIRGRETRVQAIAGQRRELAREQQGQLAALKRDVQLAYRTGQDHQLKLALNQQQPDKIARLLTYYAYLQKARGLRVQELRAMSTQLAALAAEEEEQLARLGVLKQNLNEQSVQLSEAREQREAAVAVLSAQLESQQEQLDKLARDQKALQGVVQALERAAQQEEARERDRQTKLAREKAERDRREREEAARVAKAQGKPTPPPRPEPETPREAPAPRPYSSEPDYSPTPYNGRCALPVAGGLAAQFGAPRAGGLRWNGVLISAPAGTPVRAVRSGKVVFADYLRGYGLLAIIDHGRGLMSLYGQNQTLLKQVGDSVGTNETIAQVGATGGASNLTALYFELRVRGRPSNPTAWCGF